MGRRDNFFRPRGLCRDRPRSGVLGCSGTGAMSGTRAREPYSPRQLADGTWLSASQQATFHELGRMAHTIGLSRLHHLVGNPNGTVGNLTPDLEASLTGTTEELCLALPRYANVIATTLDGYVRLAEDAPHQRELCHFCSDPAFAAAHPSFPESGLAADLYEVLCASLEPSSGKPPE